jgi:surfactin synthase thioesterase subunit
MTLRPTTTLSFDDGSLKLVELCRGGLEAKRLLCFPFAGGGPHAFAGLAEVLGNGWSLWAVDPPGHVRTKGVALTSVPEMADRYLCRIPTEILDGAILFGHSLGGYVAYAMARELEARGKPCRGLVLSGTQPPHRRERVALAQMGEEELFEWLVRLGGFVGTREDQQSFFELYHDAIRADLQAFDSFAPAPGLLTETPMKIIGAHGDALARYSELTEWSRYGASVTVSTFDGEHLFVVHEPSKVAAELVTFELALLDNRSVCS